MLKRLTRNNFHANLGAFAAFAAIGAIHCGNGGDGERCKMKGKIAYNESGGKNQWNYDNKSGNLFVEKNTGVGFEGMLKNQRLCGVALRCMLGRCEFNAARAYAIGVYSNEKRFVDFTNSSNNNNNIEIRKQFCQPPENADESRSLMLVFCKTTQGHHIGKGFDKSLIKRMRIFNSNPNTATTTATAVGTETSQPSSTASTLPVASAKKENQAIWKKSLKQFTNVFFNRKIDFIPGDIVTFTWNGPDRLIVAVNGVIEADIVSQSLCHCLFDTYFGDESVFTKNKLMHFDFTPMTNQSSS